MEKNFEILLISEKYIKNYSKLMKNVDSQIIKMHMFEAQNIDLRYVTGTELYNKIINQYYNFKEFVDGGGDPANIDDYVEPRIQTLVKESKPYLMYRTLYNAGYSLATKLTNKGIEEQSSDHSSNAELKLIENMRSELKNKSEDYVAQLKEFIGNGEYPEFKRKDKKGYSSPLYLGGAI